MNPRRILQIVRTAELATLILMLTALVTVHLPDVSRVLGPAHGLAYTATVITAILVRDGSHRVWLCVRSYPVSGASLRPVSRLHSNWIGGY